MTHLDLNSCQGECSDTTFSSSILFDSRTAVCRKRSYHLLLQGSDQMSAFPGSLSRLLTLDSAYSFCVPYIRNLRYFSHYFKIVLICLLYPRPLSLEGSDTVSHGTLVGSGQLTERSSCWNKVADGRHDLYKEALAGVQG